MEDKIRQRLMDMVVAESEANGEDWVQPWHVNAHVNSYRASDAWQLENDMGAINRVFDKLLEAHLQGKRKIEPELEPAINSFESHSTFDSLVEFTLALSKLRNNMKQSN